MEIEFYIKCNKEYSTEWLEEVKYIDSVILPYLTQMIPSTVIWSVKYVTRNADLDWDAEPDKCIEHNFAVDDNNVTCREMQDNEFTINPVNFSGRTGSQIQGSAR